MNKHRKKIWIFLILIFGIVFISSIPNIQEPKHVTPDDIFNPKKAYLYGKFEAVGEDLESPHQKSGGLAELILFDMDRDRYGKIVFICDEEDEKACFFIIPVEPGMIMVGTWLGVGFLPDPLNEELKVEAGKMYYLGDYLRGYNQIANTIYYSEIYVFNHFTKTTGIIKGKYPKFSGVTTGSLYSGEPESVGDHITGEEIVKQLEDPYGMGWNKW